MRWRVLRWPLLLAPFVVIAIAYPIDRHLKSAPSAGFTNDGADWTFQAGDLPAFLQRASTLPEWDAFTEDVARPMQLIEREVHLRTGIRPTPARWRLWLGRPFVISGRGDAWIASARPGLLVNLVHGANMALGTESREGAYVWGDLLYKFHDGFLLVFSNESVVNAALEEIPWNEETSDPTSVAVRMRFGSDEDRYRFSVEDELRVVAEFLVADVEVAAPETHNVRSMPVDAIAHVSAPTPAEALVLLDRFTRWAEQTPIIARAFSFVTERDSTLFEGFHWNTEHAMYLSVSIHDFEMKLPSFYPHFVAAHVTKSDGTPPLVANNIATPGIPYEWEGEPGMLYPLDLEGMCFATAGKDTVWYTATTELLMTKLMAQPANETISTDTTVIEWDWAAAANAVFKIGNRLSADDIEDGYEFGEVEADYGVWIRGFGKLGRGRLEGTTRNGVLTLEGTLTEIVSDGGMAE